MKLPTTHAIRLIYLVLIFSLLQCKTKSTVETPPTPTLKISLAQWSIHRALEQGTLRAEDFAAIAKNDFGISAVEYVNSFYKGHASDTAFWHRMKAKADSLEVKSLLIMVDNEGDLGNPKEEERVTAVANHHKWVDAAKILGCHSIRINAFGDGTKEEVKAAMIASLRALGTYAATKNINVLIENHGLYSADGKWVAEVITTVNLPNVGTLPDFGNWCTAAKWGSTEPSKQCQEAYDRYQGVSDMLPFAKGVSAKSYQFDADGNEKIIDYPRMLQLVRDAGYDGYIGVEYEGDLLSESEGIKATKNLLEKSWQNMKP
ncbi:MAG: sugar phosphate isomerase/epimerase family protein [Cyclobacteriaceae bacterium]|jgi:sugar phosphate isomerase/epimerase